LAGSSVERHAFARAGLLGNPSDGYFGRTLSVVIRNFRATVTLEESAELRVEPDPVDADVFHSMQEFVDAVSRQGYYGGARLVKAAVKAFSDHCAKHGMALPARNFTARYQSSIPRQVGLAGSSAIVTAALRALMDFYEVDISLELQPTLILSAEVDELGITAGLQDRVAQVYQGLVYMDFSQHLMDDLGHGAYDSLDPTLLPPMFIAHQTSPTKVSGRVLNDLRSRWQQGDPEVLVTLGRIAALATQGRDALLEGDRATFASLMNENFDLRREIMRVGERDIAMVEAARDLGASAKLTGSGGAVVGVVESDQMRNQIADELGALGVRVIEPQYG
jgi:glucuronokinase